MAINAADFVVTKTIPLAAGLKLCFGVWTPSDGTTAVGAANSYTSGGETITKAIAKAAFGFDEIKFMSFEPLILADKSAARPMVFDHAVSGTTLGKLHVYVAATGAEVASTTNLNTTSVNTSRFVVMGVG